jgi:hypothetical protein
MMKLTLLQIAGLTAGLFVAILAANLAHDQVILYQVRVAMHQAERPEQIEKLAFRQWKIDFSVSYPSLSTVIEDPGYPTHDSVLGDMYFRNYRPQYIRWADKQVP